MPDPVHLAVGDQLPTGLVTASRAARAGRSAFRTFVPGAGSLRPSVTVSDDVADVEFSASLARLTERQSERLSAQIVWTLRSVPDLRGVRIVGGTAILSARGERSHPIDSWGGFGPPSRNNTAYALVDDRLMEIDGATVRPVAGTWGEDARRCRRGGREPGLRGRGAGRTGPGPRHRPPGGRPRTFDGAAAHHAALGRRRPPLAARPPRRLDPRAGAWRATAPVRSPAGGLAGST